VTDWETVAPGVGVTVAAAVTLEPAGTLIGVGVTVTEATFVITVIVAVPLTLALAVDVAVIVAVPGVSAVTVPVCETDAIVVLLEPHVTVVARPASALTVAFRVVLPPIESVAFDGDTLTEWTTFGAVPQSPMHPPPHP
jgi:hypothetical protein